MPKVTVLMPVYNAAPFIQEAIASILAQTFTDFEFLIIDDGSTDSSRHIVDSFDDMRIIKAPNETNEGIVASLNKGISLARGTYIAIMHADDVSMPRRLEKQAHFLDAHPEVAMIAAKAAFMSASGTDEGFWNEDRITHSREQIRHMLPKTNCIVHPSVMIRSSIARKYGYNEKQRATEDYDLWLRLAADNNIIEKIDEILLRYRVHKDSITSRSNAEVGDYKEIIAKSTYLLNRAKGLCKINAFSYSVVKYLIRDFTRVTRNYAKVYALAVAREIFISLGKPAGMIYQKFFPVQHTVLLFVSFAINQIGGAERVHTDIVASNSDKLPWVILANEWNHEAIRPDKNVNYRFSNISGLLRNPFTKNLAIGFFAGYLNRSKSVAFGGNCEFFYWLVPYLDPDVFCIDFIHGFGCLIEIISLPHIPRINRRIIIAEELRRDLTLLYRDHGVSDSYLERIHMIPYGIEIPQKPLRNETKAKITIIYVGRGTEEKRVHLVGRIARHLYELRLPVSVELVGDVRESMSAGDRQYCRFIGPVYDRGVLEKVYNNADILVLTSRTEGLSLVRMEAMAHGVVPVAVAVGPIPGHIEHGVTGFLVSPDKTEDEIVLDFCLIIEKLVNDRQLLRQISSQTYEFARCHFDRAATLYSFSKLFDITEKD